MITTTRPRLGAYIWVTWLAPLLAGESSCWWASWFKAHFTYNKVTGFDGAKWQADHGPLVASARDSLLADGFAVSEEEQNKLCLRSGDIIVAGKPDLIATRGDHVIIVDCKSGCVREAHRFQVMIYLAILPFVRPELQGKQLEGLVQYPDHEVVIPASTLDQDFRVQLRKTIHRVGGAEPPARAPSAHECHFCQIGRNDCPERIDVIEPVPVTGHDIF